MIQIVSNKITEFGFKPKVIEYDTYYDIKFQSFGFESFKEKYKNVIREICGDDLMEFYYGGEGQHIYIRKNIKKERLKKLNNICQKYS